MKNDICARCANKILDVNSCLFSFTNCDTGGPFCRECANVIYNIDSYMNCSS